MHIDTITTDEELQELRENWDRIYAADPEAQFFLSWTFLNTYLRRFEGAWFILAARSGPRGTGYAALLPLRIRTKMSSKTGVARNEINMGGNFAADYTGIIAMPGYADQAIAAFAKHLKRMHWAKLHLENLRISERRWRMLTGKISDKKLVIQPETRVNPRDNIDNLICPAIQLPDSWEFYLERQLSANTRQKMRRFLRKLENSDEFRITVADASTVERDIEILLEMWRIKWKARKGNLLPGLIKSNRQVFRHGFQSGSLFLPVLWQGEKPLGALATFMDPVKKAMLFQMAGRDETANDIPSGLVLHGYSIRYAIENGFRTYDFLRGNEPYKYSFGVADTVLKCAVVRTTTGRNFGGKLDPRSLNTVLAQAVKLQREGKPAQAETAYRQILESDPHHARTLYAFGQHAAVQGDHALAAEQFRTLCAIEPQSAKAWFRLGNAQYSLRRLQEAATAFGKAVEFAPTLAPARYAYGRTLLELRQPKDAVHVLAPLVTQPPADRQGAVYRAHARALLETLGRVRRERSTLPASVGRPAPELAAV